MWRLQQDQQALGQDESFRMFYLWQSVRDWKTWLFMVVYMGAAGALYAFSLFLPSIIKELGYSSTKANLMSVPPYVLAAAMTVAVGYYADRTGRRGQFNIAVPCLSVAGFSMLLASDRPGVKYAGTFLGALGIYPCIANTISWASNNFEGVYKRGVSLGFVIGWGNLNGIVSSNIYRDRAGSRPPNYKSGHAVVLLYIVVFLMLGSAVTHVGLRRENAARRAGRRDHLALDKTEQQLRDMGDRRPDFVYTE